MFGDVGILFEDVIVPMVPSETTYFSLDIFKTIDEPEKIPWVSESIVASSVNKFNQGIYLPIAIAPQSKIKVIDETKTKLDLFLRFDIPAFKKHYKLKIQPGAGIVLDAANTILLNTKNNPLQANITNKSVYEWTLNVESSNISLDKYQTPTNFHSINEVVKDNGILYEPGYTILTEKPITALDNNSLFRASLIPKPNYVRIGLKIPLNIFPSNEDPTWYIELFSGTKKLASTSSRLRGISIPSPLNVVLKSTSLIPGARNLVKLKLSLDEQLTTYFPRSIPSNTFGDNIDNLYQPTGETDSITRDGPVYNPSEGSIYLNDGSNNGTQLEPYIPTEEQILERLLFGPCVPSATLPTVLPKDWHVVEPCWRNSNIAILITLPTQTTFLNETPTIVGLQKVTSIIEENRLNIILPDDFIKNNLEFSFAIQNGVNINSDRWEVSLIHVHSGFTLFLGFIASPPLNPLETLYWLPVQAGIPSKGFIRLTLPLDLELGSVIEFGQWIGSHKFTIDCIIQNTQNIGSTYLYLEPRNIWVCKDARRQNFHAVQWQPSIALQKNTVIELGFGIISPIIEAESQNLYLAIVDSNKRLLRSTFHTIRQETISFPLIVERISTRTTTANTISTIEIFFRVDSKIPGTSNSVIKVNLPDEIKLDSSKDIQFSLIPLPLSKIKKIHLGLHFIVIYLEEYKSLQPGQYGFTFFVKNPVEPGPIGAWMIEYYDSDIVRLRERFHNYDATKSLDI